MTKVTIDLDPEALPTTVLTDLFMHAGLALERRGEWALERCLSSAQTPVERFMGELPAGALGVWAQAAVAEAGRRGVSITRPRSTPAINTRLNGPERALAEGGQKVPAIKALRERSDLSLKEAKDEVDAWIANAQDRRVELLAKVLSEALAVGSGSAP